MASAQGKLSYLRVITPRVRGDDDNDGGGSGSAGGSGGGGKRRYVVQDGRVVEVTTNAGSDGGSGPASTVTKNWGPGNIDADSLRRHEALMKRFRYENRPGGPPPGPLR